MRGVALLALYALVLFLLVLFSTSCGPEKRLARILRKNPHLKSVDSVRIVDSVLITGIDVSATIRGDTSTEALDSAINSLKHFIPDSLFPDIVTEIRTIYMTREFIADTIVQVVDGVTITLWQNGSEIGINVRKPDKWTVREIVVPCPDLEYAPTKWDKFWISTGKLAIALVVLLIIGAYIYGKVRRKNQGG